MYLVDEYKDRLYLSLITWIQSVLILTRPQEKNIVKLPSKERSWSSSGLLTQGVG